MAWKYNNKIIRAGRGWTDSNGIKHPTNWMQWSDAEKTAAGLVWENDPTPFDNRFYWDATTAKSLDDVNEVDDDGDAVLDVDGNQVVTLGLKSVYKAETKAKAAGLLAPYDWYVVRKAEDSTATIPSNVATYRSAVRTASGTIETAIDGAADHAAFVALFDVPVDANGDPTGKAPIDNWPDPID
jgi:hypothetical protein